MDDFKEYLYVHATSFGCFGEREPERVRWNRRSLRNVSLDIAGVKLHFVGETDIYLRPMRQDLSAADVRLPDGETEATILALWRDIPTITVCVAEAPVATLRVRTYLDVNKQRRAISFPRLLTPFTDNDRCHSERVAVMLGCDWLEVTTMPKGECEL